MTEQQQEIEFLRSKISELQKEKEALEAIVRRLEELIENAKKVACES